MVRLKQNCVEESIWGRCKFKSLFFFFISFSESMFCSQGDMENVVMGEHPGYHIPHYVCMWMEGRGWSEATLPRATIHDDDPFLFWSRRKEGERQEKGIKFLLPPAFLLQIAVKKLPSIWLSCVQSKPLSTPFKK